MDFGDLKNKHINQGFKCLKNLIDKCKYLIYLFDITYLLDIVLYTCVKMRHLVVASFGWATVMPPIS